MLTAAEVRRRKILGALSVGLGLLLLVVATLAITGNLGSTDPKERPPAGTSPAADSASGSTSSAASSESGPDDTRAPLTVLNGSTTAGLAAKARTAFEDAGWEVSEVGNFTEDGPEQSTVYYPADDQQAKKAAENLAAEFPALVAEEAPDGFGYTGVVVVLTGDWQPG